MQNDTSIENSNCIWRSEGNVFYLVPPHLMTGSDDEHADSSNPRCEGGVCTILFKPNKPQRPAA